MARGVPFCLAHLDVNFEDGIWKDFPPAPWIIKFVVRNITWWVHSDWWKFAASDRNGKLKPLYAC